MAETQAAGSRKRWEVGWRVPGWSSMEKHGQAWPRSWPREAVGSGLKGAGLEHSTDGSSMGNTYSEVLVQCPCVCTSF
jgi:hypothetical protein